MPKLPKRNPYPFEDVPVPITVVDDAAAEKADYVICKRVRSDVDPVVPNSYQVACFLCQTRVWVAPWAPLTPPKICLQCAGDLARKQ